MTADVAQLSTGNGERVHLVDIAAALGRHPRTGVGATSAKQLLATMDRFGIAEAVVSHLTSRWHAPAVGNRHLLDQLADADRLRPCWTVLPDTCGEVAGPDQFVTEARESGVVAVRAFPADHRYRLDGPEMTGLHTALAQARLPLLVDASQTSWDAVEAVAHRFPEHTLVVGDTGYRSLRTIAGVLSRCPNVHLELSYLASHCGLEWLVGRFGADRFVLGTGWPVRDPAEAVTRLLWSELDDGAVRRIGGLTAYRLLGLGAEGR